MHAVIDTNVLLYDTFEDLPFHHEARRLLDSLDRWYVPPIVLQEYVWFFKRKNLPVKLVRSMLSEYLDDPRFNRLNDNGESIAYALELIEKNSLSLSRFNDAIILYHALQRGYPLATFDKKFRKLAVKNGVEVLPAKV
ncbi:DNA-binding protein [Thermococcus siculi]|uniref:Ribonuclease VapC n=1 Tax=Thermococcus siculi TaxID=72803 RepID=A0A2Z2MSR7_9EURY|nr:PIN domain-containing protein [Thermococcus siculi]ASJ08826.1 DNA-binding protein [Thermococcus siculi]